MLGQSCIVKVKLPSQKGLKSTIDLSSKKLSSNPAYSKIDINFSTGTTHSSTSQSQQDFLHCIKIFDISAAFPISLPSWMKKRTICETGWKKKRKKKQQKHSPPRKPINQTNPIHLTGWDRIQTSPEPRMTIKGRGVSLHIIKCALGHRNDLRSLLRISSPFTLQVSGFNTFQVLLPVSAVMRPYQAMCHNHPLTWYLLTFTHTLSYNIRK